MMGCGSIRCDAKPPDFGGPCRRCTCFTHLDEETAAKARAYCFAWRCSGKRKPEAQLVEQRYIDDGCHWFMEKHWKPEVAIGAVILCEMEGGRWGRDSEHDTGIVGADVVHLETNKTRVVDYHPRVG